MTSVESRLQDTEAALYAALNALHNRGGIGSIAFPTDCSTLTMSKPQRSKAEKQNGWKRQQLQTSEDLVAWFVQRKHQNATTHGRPQTITAPPEHPPRDDTSGAEPSTICAASGAEALDFSAHTHPSSTPSVDVMKQLRSCRCPTVPNLSLSSATSAAWLKNYF
jgi:hypothetical protein